MEIDAARLLDLLPHRPPILMLDKVVDVVPRESGAGLRSFRAGDPCFEGHFPDLPILPGALVIEAFAQTAMAVFLADPADQKAAGTIGLLAKVNEMTFFEKIAPGTIVRFSIRVERSVGPFAFVSCEALGSGGKFAAGKLTLKIGD